MIVFFRKNDHSPTVRIAGACGQRTGSPPARAASSGGAVSDSDTLSVFLSSRLLLLSMHHQSQLDHQTVQINGQIGKAAHLLVFKQRLLQSLALGVRLL
jgi:hypothetical protein